MTSAGAECHAPSPPPPLPLSPDTEEQGRPVYLLAGSAKPPIRQAQLTAAVRDACLFQAPRPAYLLADSAKPPIRQAQLTAAVRDACLFQAPRPLTTTRSLPTLPPPRSGTTRLLTLLCEVICASDTTLHHTPTACNDHIVKNNNYQQQQQPSLSFLLCLFNLATHTGACTCPCKRRLSQYHDAAWEDGERYCRPSP